MLQKKNTEKIVKVVFTGQPPLEVLDNYQLLLNSLDALIKQCNISVAEIMDLTGLSESQYFRRRNDPTIWTPDELRPLVKKIQKQIGTLS